MKKSQNFMLNLMKGWQILKIKISKIQKIQRHL